MASLILTSTTTIVLNATIKTISQPTPTPPSPTPPPPTTPPTTTPMTTKLPMSPTLPPSSRDQYDVCCTHGADYTRV